MRARETVIQGGCAGKRRVDSRSAGTSSFPNDGDQHLTVSPLVFYCPMTKSVTDSLTETARLSEGSACLRSGELEHTFYGRGCSSRLLCVS